MAERTPVELMLVDRMGGWVGDGECAACGRTTALPFGLFVGTVGEPVGVVELCAECAPLVDRLAGHVADVAPEQVTVLSGDEATAN